MVKISELQNELEELKIEHGDIEVALATLPDCVLEGITVVKHIKQSEGLYIVDQFSELQDSIVGIL